MTATEIHFTDYFHVDPAVLQKYGAFNISLVADLPLFIDPFLLFNSPKRQYQDLHEEMIRYLRFLRDKSGATDIDQGLLRAWFLFGEVRQTWLGFTTFGNRGSGLGWDFARALQKNLNTIFRTFGQEQITHGSHLEKLCLIRSGVGRDNISDFTTNLIKGFLLEYTETFTVRHVPKQLRRVVSVPRVKFNYDTEVWQAGEYELPMFRGDFVLLTPRDILTRDEIWIDRPGLFLEFERIVTALPDEALRAQVNNYFLQRLSKEPTRKEKDLSIEAAIAKYPEVIEYYIRSREYNGNTATSISQSRVQDSEAVFITQVRELVELLRANTAFYSISGSTYDEARQRVAFFKDMIENKGGHALCYLKKKPIVRETDLQLMFRFTWMGTQSDVGREVNDGRGPVDYKISRGSRDKSLVEFKLARNSHLKQNLAKQVEIYQKASDATKAIKVIVYFTSEEHEKVQKILRELGLSRDQDIILIDARADNKPSGSKA